MAGGQLPEARLWEECLSGGAPTAPGRRGWGAAGGELRIWKPLRAARAVGSVLFRKTLPPAEQGPQTCWDLAVPLGAKLWEGQGQRRPAGLDRGLGRSGRQFPADDLKCLMQPLSHMTDDTFLVKSSDVKLESSGSADPSQAQQLMAQSSPGCSLTTAPRPSASGKAATAPWAAPSGLPAPHPPLLLHWAPSAHMGVPLLGPSSDLGGGRT